MCKFCEAYKGYKRTGQFKTTHPQYYDGEKWCQEITVAIVVHGWWKSRGKKSAGRSVDYRYKGLGFKLKYCPECGRKL